MTTAQQPDAVSKAASVQSGSHGLAALEGSRRGPAGSSRQGLSKVEGSTRPVPRQPETSLKVSTVPGRVAKPQGPCKPGMSRAEGSVGPAPEQSGSRPRAEPLAKGQVSQPQGPAQKGPSTAAQGSLHFVPEQSSSSSNFRAGPAPEGSKGKPQDAARRGPSAAQGSSRMCQRGQGGSSRADANGRKAKQMPAEAARRGKKRMLQVSIFVCFGNLY